MSTRVTQQEAADRIFAIYADHVDEPLTDRKIAAMTDLTTSQVQYGKILVREAVAADHGLMYVSSAGRKGGSYLTESVIDGRTYVSGHAKVARVQADRLLNSTIRQLVTADPQAKFIARQFERLVEDLDMLAEISGT